MKKQLLLLAGGLLALASCNTATEGASDAQIDSMVNTRVEELRMEMMRQNDSLINAMAQIKADSIIAAMKGGSSVTTKTTTTRTTKVSGSKETPIEEKKTQTIGSGKPKIGNQNDNNTIGTGKPKIGDKKEENTIGTGKPKIGDRK